MGNTKKYLAEGLGTAVLVFIACGTAVVTQADVVATALAFGLTIVAMAYSIGPISGCHVNPAVSLGVAIANRMTWKECIFYIISQFIGACIGGALLWLIIYGAKGTIAGLGQNSFSGEFFVNATPSLRIYVALLFEAILTFVFVFAVLGVTAKGDRPVNGLVIGLTLTLVHLIGIKVTGTSVNPARSFGVAIFDCKAFCEVWVFLVAPMVGGFFAGYLSKYFTNDKV